jgi:hypothetical protein
VFAESSLTVIRLAPPPTFPARRFRPRRPEGRRFVCSVPSEHHVPHSWFLSTVTVCSARQPQVYCNLVPAMGFTAFPPSPALRLGRIPHPGPVRRLPRNAVHTPRRIPLVSSRTASLRPLPSCGCHLFRPVDQRAPKNTLRATLRPQPPKPLSAASAGRNQWVRGESPREQRLCPLPKLWDESLRRRQPRTQPKPSEKPSPERESRKLRTEQARPALPPESGESSEPHPPKRVRFRWRSAETLFLQVVAIPRNPTLQRDFRCR